MVTMYAIFNYNLMNSSLCNVGAETQSRGDVRDVQARVI